MLGYPTTASVRRWESNSELAQRLLGFANSFADYLAHPWAARISRKGLQLSDVHWKFVNKGRDLLAYDRNGQHSNPDDEHADDAQRGTARFSSNRSSRATNGLSR